MNNQHRDSDLLKGKGLINGAYPENQRRLFQIEIDIKQTRETKKK
jgi:hypothetical protein